MSNLNLQELYISLFRSDTLAIYKERMGRISEAILGIGSENYLPNKLGLMEKDFPGPCSAYVCVSSYDHTWHDQLSGINNYKYYPVGIVLARHNHWDRDYHLNHYRHDAYVAGGPIEREDHRKNWFPIYRQADLIKAVDFMVELHREDLFKMLRNEKEGFLSPE